MACGSVGTSQDTSYIASTILKLLEKRGGEIGTRLSADSFVRGMTSISEMMALCHFCLEHTSKKDLKS